MSNDDAVNRFVSSVRSNGTRLEEAIQEVKQEWTAQLREEAYQIEREMIPTRRDG